MDGYTRDGLTFDVVDSGPRDGETVVLLHGFPQTASSWTKVAEHLHAAGCRTVAPTQRGYSPGARPRGRRAYRMAELVADASALVDALDAGPVHLVGHDWGSAVAWSLAAARPDLIRTLTSVSAPHPGAFVRSMTRSPQLLRSWYMFLFQVPGLVELGGRLRPDRFAATLRRLGMTPDEAARARREILDAGALTGGLNWYRAMMLGNPREFGARITVPTTHVWSDGDRMLDRRGAELSADFVDADFALEILPGDHWIPDHHPAELAAIVLGRIASAR